MVSRLPAVFRDSKISVDIAGGNGHNFEELRRADVIRAAASDQDPSGTKHLEGAQIELFVAT